MSVRECEARNTVKLLHTCFCADVPEIRAIEIFREFYHCFVVCGQCIIIITSFGSPQYIEVVSTVVSLASATAPSFA